MPSHRLEELSYTQLDGFDRKKTLFVLAVSPLEEHGPHLPLGVDAFNAEFFAGELTRLFLEQYPDWNVVHIPSFFVGSFLFDAPGSIRVRPAAIRDLVADSFSSLAKYGFQYFLVSNAHGGPTHIVALEEATRWITRRYRARAVSFSGHLIWNFLRGHYWDEMQVELNLSPDQIKRLREDAHAGQWETSMMLKLKPHLVNRTYDTLSSFAPKWFHRLRPNYPMKMGERLGYVGHPSQASEQFATETSLFLAKKAFGMVVEELFSENIPRPSVFYRLVVFRRNFVMVTLLLTALIGLGMFYLLWLR